MKIVASNIPGYYPSGFNEQIYLVGERSVNQVKDYSLIETEQKYKVVNDETYRTRKVQTVFYDKYEIEFITTENIDIGILNVAGEITIIQDNGEQHLAELIDFPEPTKGAQSEYRIYNIVYRDLNSKITVNHLTYDSVDNPDYVAKLDISQKFTLKEYFSPVVPILDISEYNRTVDDSNYIEQVSSENAFKTITFIAYLKEAEKNELLEYLNAESAIGKPSLGGSNFITLTYNSTGYTAIQTPEVTIDQGDLEGIFFITVTVPYEQILNYIND